MRGRPLFDVNIWTECQCVVHYTLSLKKHVCEVWELQLDQTFFSPKLIKKNSLKIILIRHKTTRHFHSSQGAKSQSAHTSYKVMPGGLCPQCVIISKCNRDGIRNFLNWKPETFKMNLSLLFLSRLLEVNYSMMSLENLFHRVVCLFLIFISCLTTLQFSRDCVMGDTVLSIT